MKHKVAELEGALLDAAVAKAEGVGFHLEDQQFGNGPKRVCVAHWGMAEDRRRYAPSTHWHSGGPILQRERITLLGHDDEWNAATKILMSNGCIERSGVFTSGGTPLIAAMRAYVASKFGEEVDL